MGVEMGIWRVGKDNETCMMPTVGIDKESRLEDILDRRISILFGERQVMVIGRQVQTPYSDPDAPPEDNGHGIIDLLALDADGVPIVIELKRGKSTRLVVSQTLDYAAWVATFGYEEFNETYKKYLDARWERQRKHDEASGLIVLAEKPKTWPSLAEAFLAGFGEELDGETLNARHEMLVVATALHAESERVFHYLRDTYQVPINAVFFRHFNDDTGEYLANAWLVEPEETALPVNQDAKRVSEGGSWNGEYYATFRMEDPRKVDAGLEYGFISAGGGPVYAKPLEQLRRGDRVWVNEGAKAGCRGYVGVAEVLDPAEDADTFTVEKDGVPVPVTGLPAWADATLAADDPARADRFVRVRWLHRLPGKKPGTWLGTKRVGLFGIMTTVARPTTPKWDYTVGQLKEEWGIKG